MRDLKLARKAYKAHSHKLRNGNKEKFMNQISRVAIYLNNRYDILIKSVTFGTVNDDFIKDKITVLFKFEIYYERPQQRTSESTCKK